MGKYLIGCKCCEQSIWTKRFWNIFNGSRSTTNKPNFKICHDLCFWGFSSMQFITIVKLCTIITTIFNYYWSIDCNYCLALTVQCAYFITDKWWTNRYSSTQTLTISRGATYPLPCATSLNKRTDSLVSLSPTITYT